MTMSSQQVAIYGAAKFGQLFCLNLERTGVRVDFFIDQYISKAHVLGKPIYRIDDFPETDRSNIVVHVSAMPFSFIRNNLVTAGYKAYSFMETCQMAFPSLLEELLTTSHMWFDRDVSNMLNSSKIEQFSKLLNDVSSLKLLEQIVAFRKTPSPDTYVSPSDDIRHQYFPLDIPLFSKLDALRFVDCGAFTGDTISHAMKYFRQIEKKLAYVIAFEPDEQNFTKLIAEVALQQTNSIDTLFMIYPCGLWSDNTILNFDSGKYGASSIKLSDGNISVPTVALDKTLIGAHPNYIKMDIEGAEQQAIIGAKQLIAEESPILAISLYHKPADLWEIPLLIDSINPNYDMYLRLYSELGLETVLYCVPKM